MIFNHIIRFEKEAIRKSTHIDESSPVVEQIIMIGTE